VYIEDKKTREEGRAASATTDGDAVMYSDRKTVLLEAQRSLASLIEYWHLGCDGRAAAPECITGIKRSLTRPPLCSYEDNERLCIPAVHTQWPKVRQGALGNT
jgi:hypothetical protein